MLGVPARVFDVVRLEGDGCEFRGVRGALRDGAKDRIAHRVFGFVGGLVVAIGVTLDLVEQAADLIGLHGAKDTPR